MHPFAVHYPKSYDPAMTNTTKSHGPTRWEISVTQADIDRAITKNSAKCVVVQAIARTLPTATRIEVDTQTVRFTIDGERYAYLTPYSVSGYVIGFDAGDSIHPFRFRLYEDQKVAVRSRKRTPAGLATQAADKKAKAAQAKAAAAQQTLDEMLDEVEPALNDPVLPPPTAAQIKAVKAQVKATEAAVKAAEENSDSVKAAYAAQAKSTTSETGRRSQRVFKTSARHYGHRALRINQQS